MPRQHTATALTFALLRSSFFLSWSTLLSWSILPVLLFFFTALPAAAQQDGERHAMHHGRTVSVSGEGSVRATPDEATVRFGIVTEGQNVEQVRAQNAEAASDALNAARELVDKENIRLQELRIEPRYERDDDGQGRHRAGYRATRTAVVRLDDLDVLPTLVARVVERGANRLEGIQYDIQDRSAPRRDAFREAARNAEAKAEVLAQTLGASVGRVVRISEQSYHFPQPRYEVQEQESVAMSRDAATPSPDAYASGDLEVTANVQVTFALE